MKSLTSSSKRAFQCYLRQMHPNWLSSPDVYMKAKVAVVLLVSRMVNSSSRLTSWLTSYLDYLHWLPFEVLLSKSSADPHSEES